MNSYSEKKDSVLVELTLLGNEEAYRELVIRHEKAVKGTAYKVTGNLYSAEDASQDAFVSAWVHLDSLRSRDSFKSWVCSIAKNCAKNIVVRYSAMMPDITLDLQSYDETDFEKIELHDSVSMLSDKIRQVVELHYFEGMSVQEIADKLSLSAGTVKWRLHEGRKQLRKEYGIMEKDYDENVSLVQRVMYQVERLKLWGLKNDKTGFEAEYKQVLGAVESLEDSVEKDHALADVLLRGYWWIYNSSDDELFKRIKETVSTPAGEFNNCYVYILQTLKNKGVKYVRTVFAPGVGIVEQNSDMWGEKHSWQLSEYEITGGEGLLPLAQGNRWRYEHKDTDKGIMFNRNNSYEIIFSHDDHAISKSVDLSYQTGYYDTWHGNTLRYANEYAGETKDGGWRLNDVSTLIESAEDQAVTKRQKIHTAIAKDVMNRIFETNDIYNPDYKEKGRWNFFDIHLVCMNDKSISFECYEGRSFSFEWKDTAYFDKEGNKVLYNSIYDTLDDICDCIWSQDWVPGYHFVKEEREVYSMKTKLTIDVTADEDIYTPSGEFKGCRHICINVEGLHGGWSYIGGKREYWFAPQVGIVRMKHDNCDWHLTEYRGTGEGYFPVADGLFRRYEPTELGSGYHASVEYTFDEDEEGIVIFRNALGNQDRTNYEAAKHKAENKI